MFSVLLFYVRCFLHIGGFIHFSMIRYLVGAASSVFLSWCSKPLCSASSSVAIIGDRSIIGQRYRLAMMCACSALGWCPTICPRARLPYVRPSPSGAHHPLNARPLTLEILQYAALPSSKIRFSSLVLTAHMNASPSTLTFLQYAAMTWG